MKNKVLTFLAAILILITNSCKKEANTMECVKVKYVSSYCLKNGSDLVAVLDNADRNQLVLLNLPEVYKVPDKIFYVSYHYDAASDKLDENTACPAMFSAQKIYVYDSASESDCKN